MILDAADMRNIFELIDHLRRMGDQPSRWKPCMASRLCGLLSARVSICLETVASGTKPRSQPQTNLVVALPDGGFLQSAAANPGGRINLDRPLFADTDSTAKTAGAVRIASVASRGFDMLPGRSGDAAFSHQSYSSPRVKQCLFLLRSSQDPAFSLRHRAMLQLFHTELKRAITRDAPGRPPHGGMTIPALSPRLSQTLALLSEGLSEKQVAARLGCRPGTLHDYIKELHKRFAVSSRAELLAAHIRINLQSAGRLQL